MSVELDPPELGFRRPFSKEVQQSLHLSNPHSDPVAFKVKTTAPKQYCVRPNSGRIDPGKSVEVQVLLQAMKEDPPPEAKCRDKFLVQSVAVTTDKEFSNIAAIWQNVEKTAKSSIQEKKIRVTFLPVLDGANGSSSTPAVITNGTENGTRSTAHEDSPPAYTSPENTVFSDSASTATPSRTPINDDSILGSAKSTVMSTPAAVSNATSSVVSAVPTTSEDMKSQLASANAQIASLKDQLAEGMRQRKGAPSAALGGAAGQGALQQQVLGQGPGSQDMAGVPVQIVAGLCLLSFLLAYFFF